MSNKIDTMYGMNLFILIFSPPQKKNSIFFISFMLLFQFETLSLNIEQNKYYALQKLKWALKIIHSKGQYAIKG